MKALLATLVLCSSVFAQAAGGYIPRTGSGGGTNSMLMNKFLCTVQGSVLLVKGGEAKEVAVEAHTIKLNSRTENEAVAAINGATIARHLEQGTNLNLYNLEIRCAQSSDE